jgi:hypothetical protein
MLSSVNWPQSVSSDTAGSFNNANYLAVISCTDKNISVSANLPQEFSMDMHANYEEAFSQGLSGLLGGKAESVGKAMRLLGMQLTTKALTAQVWQGSTEVAFSLPLIFQVESSEDDVLIPLQKLYSLLLPTESAAGGLLEAPGPVVDLAKLKSQSIDFDTSGLTGLDLTKGASGLVNSALSSADNFKNTAGKGLQSFTNAFTSSIKNNISLSIGSRIRLPSVVITSISTNTDVLPLDGGVFQRVTATVGIKTFYVPTQNDIPDLVGLKSKRKVL